jgi:glycosyltransferase involved in cell wall biosynthesis
MKILLTTSARYDTSYGGGQVYLNNIVASLQHTGVEVAVVSLVVSENSKTAQFHQKRVGKLSIWEIELPSYLRGVGEPLQLTEISCDSLEASIDQIKPDLIHAHGWESTTVKVAHDLGIPCIITAHHGGIVCPNGFLMNNNEQLCQLPVSERNCLNCTLHFVPGGNFWAPLVGKSPQNVRENVTKILRGKPNIPFVSSAWFVPQDIEQKVEQIDVMRSYTDCVIAPSRSIAEALLRNGFTEKQVVIIPHGVEPFQNQPVLAGYPARPLRLGYVGRINYIKGVHLILKALKLLPNPQRVELLVYGEAVSNSERRYLKGLLKDSVGLNVTWYGKVSHDEIADAYYQMDILLLTSICTEIYGLTVAEALSVGRPVIASRCGGPEDIITDGQNGFLVPTNDAQALADTIKRFIDEPHLLYTMAEYAKPTVSLQNHIDDLMQIYKSLYSDKEACLSL